MFREIKVKVYFIFYVSCGCWGEIGSSRVLETDLYLAWQKFLCFSFILPPCKICMYLHLYFTFVFYYFSEFFIYAYLRFLLLHIIPDITVFFLHFHFLSYSFIHCVYFTHLPYVTFSSFTLHFFPLSNFIIFFLFFFISHLRFFFFWSLSFFLLPFTFPHSHH